MKTELIVFDIAGTTLNDDESVVSDCFKQALEAHGFSFQTEDFTEVMGFKKIEAIRMLLEKSEKEVTDKKVHEIHDKFLELINAHFKTAEISEVEGASELFDSLKKKGIKIALNTGFSRSTADIIMDRLDWKDSLLIDATLCSDEVEKGRPHPDMIRQLMKTLKVEESENVVKVGDTPSDLMEGSNAGCGLTIGVLYGSHTLEQLQDYPHDYLISKILDIKPLLGIK